MKEWKSKYVLVLMWNIFRKIPFLTSIALMIPILTGVLNVLVYNFYGKLIDVITNDLGVMERDQIINKLAIITAFYVSILVSQVIAQYLNKLVAEKLKYSIQLIFREEIIDATKETPCTKFDDSDYYNKLQRAKVVLEDDMTNIINRIILCISSMSSIASIIILSLQCKNIVVTLLVTSVILITLVSRIKIEIGIRTLNINMTYEGRQSEYLAKLFTDSNSIREMRVYKSADYFLKRFETLLVTQMTRRYGARENEIKIGGFLSILQIFMIYVVLRILLTTDITRNNVTIGTITALLIALLSFNKYIFDMIFPVAKLYADSTKIYDLNQILKMKVGTTKLQKINKQDDMQIDFQDVSFCYPNSTRNVLNGINCCIKKGEKVALVGENGAGKSTFIKLLMNQYQPSSGKVLLHRKENNSINLAVVFQSFLKINLSLRENIALGNRREFYNDEKIMEVLYECELMNVYKRVGSLDAPIGRVIDGAVELSGGEWQKLAIARALFSDADLIILDEPTASVDPVSELEIYNKLIEICKDKTAIFISHRLGWARNADRILVLQDGKIIEDGIHGKLMDNNGVYANMYHLQAQWYV